MNKIMHVALSALLVLAMVITTSTPVAAQQQFTVVKRVAVAEPEETGELSAELQRELEGGSAPALPGARLKAAGGDDGGSRYTCNSGNCACSGACQCVAMEDICMPDTIGCSDYGCTCKQKADTEPKEPNC